jgi:uncharacterized Zn-finger protein
MDSESDLATTSEMTGSGLCQPANTHQTYYVSRRDLPVSCPMPDMCLWNSHPRVYLPLEETGAVRCPYCSALYILTGSDPDQGVGEEAGI